jgi:hypothetical protein
MKTLLKNKYVQWILILLVGIAIGAIFYPSKTIRIEEQQKYEKKLKRVEEQHLKILSEQTSKYEAELKVNKSIMDEAHEKFHSLKKENHELRQKTDEGTLKIIKPDGTIVEKTYKKTETEQLSQITTEITQEFNHKVKSIESKWKTIHSQRISKIKKDFDKKINEKIYEISELKRKKTVEINKRSFGIAVGFLSSEEYYFNISYDIFGPVFLNAHTETNFQDDFAVGGGLGLRF